ncbi:MAG TPA: ferredoxin reductase family protein [Candidatus Saccharimonadia bacterium]|nr:ferredoxin reductase family protein [Candidatus Saccharimonadia bacterium]
MSITNWAPARAKQALQRHLSLIVVGVGLAVILVAWWHTSAAPATTMASKEIALGRLMGLVAVYGSLLELVMMARLRVLEQGFGFEQLLKWHKLIGYSIIIGIVLHVLLLVYGYQIDGRSGLWAQFWDFIFNYPDVLKALLGALMFLVIVGISVSIVRLRLNYEWWYWVHLTTYLAIVLAFSHQLSAGGDFVGHPLFGAFWWGLYLAVFGLIGLFRFVDPVVQWLRHDFRVARVEAEAKGIYSLYITGRRLERMEVVAGQFYIWRFLAPELWWETHPFSLSMAPGGHELRLTFKQVGDFTQRLAAVKPGTSVVLDGPRGNFTLDRAHGRQLLLLAGGIGITPLRAMAEALPADYDAVLVYACRRDQRAFASELTELARRHPNLRVVTVIEEEAGRLSAAQLAHLVPDAADRDAYVCGPPVMVEAMRLVLLQVGVAEARLHSERFAF